METAQAVKCQPHRLEGLHSSEPRQPQNPVSSRDLLESELLVIPTENLESKRCLKLTGQTAYLTSPTPVRDPVTRKPQTITQNKEHYLKNNT